MKFKLGKRFINVFASDDPHAPLVIINIFMGEGEKLYQELSKKPHGKFSLCCIGGLDWGHDMSPWDQKALLKDSSSCSAGARDYLDELCSYLIPEVKKRCTLEPAFLVLCGYSLGGLFALWSLYQTDLFKRAGSFSGSLWFPDFLPFIKTHTLKAVPDRIYLSLGDREKLNSQALIATVEQNTLDTLHFYKTAGINCAFEFNQGGHDLNCDWRCARGILALTAKNPPIFKKNQQNNS